MYALFSLGASSFVRASGSVRLKSPGALAGVAFLEKSICYCLGAASGCERSGWKSPVKMRPLAEGVVDLRDYAIFGGSAFTGFGRCLH